MKLQFGILYRDERVADRQDLDTLLGDYASYNAETSGEHFDGPLLMGYRGDKITWEEDSETQPFSLGPYTITFDGRLDNREDIAAKIGIIADRNLPDPTLILQAYEKYGDSLLPDLIGEFALTIWRSDTRELIFCRSVDGARPLFYLADSKRVMWCSDIAHIVTIPHATMKLDFTYLWEYLVATPRAELTPFAAIHAVKPGTSLHFVNNAIHTEVALWEPSSVQPISLNSDKDYEERLCHEVKEAIRLRLRAKSTVFADLSGGLDSSSLALTADTVLRESHQNPKQLRTISMVYDTSRTADERYFIMLVESLRNINSIYISEADQGFRVNFTDISFNGFPSVHDLTPGRYSSYSRCMKEHNAALLLTGAGGDHIFCSTPYPESIVADSLVTGELVQAHRLSSTWGRLLGRTYFDILFRKAVPMLMSPYIPRRWRYDVLEVPPWLNRESHRLRPIVHCERRLLPSQRLRIGVTEAFFRTVAPGSCIEFGDLYVSHPFNHRPLVEFCISVPMTQMQRNGVTRSLLRRAFNSTLPTKIRDRKGKCFVYEPFARAVERDWHHLQDCHKWDISTAGLVRPKELRNSLSELRLGLSTSSRANCALVAVALERFLRSLRVVAQPHRA